tara:strand:- start:233637 stop:235205 length:1569 start_codon:yes stop_codon:yes gene_type:complete
MRFTLTTIFFFFFLLDIFGQSNNDYTDMLLEAQNNLYVQPAESVKIAEHIIQKTTNSTQRIQAHLLDAEAFTVMGNYDNAVKANIEAKKLAESAQDLERVVKTSVSSIVLLNQLGMDVVAKEYFLRTKTFVGETNKQKIATYLKGGTELLEGYTFLETENYSQALQKFINANSFFNEIPDEILRNQTTAVLIETYLPATNLDSAKQFFQSTLQNTSGAPPNNFLQMVTLNQLGKVYFLQKDYYQSLTSYQAALEISENLNNKPYISKIMEGLSATYLALDKASLFYSNRTESSQITNTVEVEEDKAVNSLYNYINDNHTEQKEKVKKAYQNNLMLMGGILFLLLLTWAILRYRYRNRARQYERFINYFEKKQNPIETLPEKEVSKRMNIPKETEESLIKKLNQFENSKQFTKQDMSLALLASQFETNTKYLSEIINTYKNKNFNSYINELRINYITDRLKNNKTYLQYKISYLAEESGFSSHSSFATVFKAVTGIPPTVFIELLRDQKKQSKIYAEEYEEAE